MHLARILFSRNNNWYFLLNNNGQVMWLLVILWGHYATRGSPGLPSDLCLHYPQQRPTPGHTVLQIFSVPPTLFPELSLVLLRSRKQAANKNTMGNIKTSFHAAICINLYKSPRRLMWPCLVKKQAKAKSIPYISPRLSPRTFCFHIFSTDK